MSREEKINNETSKRLFYEMLLIRRFEEKAGQLYGMGMIGGFCHLYIGEEAVVVGLSNLMDKNDAVITSYRAHGHAIMFGIEPKIVLAELMGRATGCSLGKGGSMHMFNVDRNFYGGHGIVGAQVPIGTGIAFAMKYQNMNNISMTYFGDGAANQGQVFEAMNMAKMWHLPVLYIIENNEYSMGTSVQRHTANTNLFERGKSFNIEGEQVNGMDIFEVMQKGRKAIEYVRSGKGPYILELKTYRYRGHSMSDPAKYRSKDEVEKYRDRDPIEILKKYMLEKQNIKESEIKTIEEEVKVKVADAVSYAQNSPEPDEQELYTHVYR